MVEENNIGEILVEWRFPHVDASGVFTASEFMPKDRYRRCPEIARVHPADINPHIKDRLIIRETLSESRLVRTVFPFPTNAPKAAPEFRPEFRIHFDV